MLVAHLNNVRIEASSANKDGKFTCPKCNDTVVLKQGNIRVHHFAHRPDSICEYGTGETPAHLRAKFILAASLRARGWRVEVEYVIGDRRADVICWPPHLNGMAFVIEIQHTIISLDEIFERANDYAQRGYAQTWISIWKNKIQLDSSDVMERYVAPPYERWIQGFNIGKGLWYFDPKIDLFRWARLSTCWLYQEEREWYNEYGEEQYAPASEYHSKRWRTLTLMWACSADELMFNIKFRAGKVLSYYHWPRCMRGVIYNEDAIRVLNNTTKSEAA
jgi:competence protein CoiA